MNEEIIKSLSYKKLSMSRVPLNTYNRFMKLANAEDFCNDFGMTLKHLLDFYEGLVPVGDEHILMELEEIKKKLAVLESNAAEKPEEKKTIKTLGGKEKVM